MKKNFIAGAVVGGLIFGTVGVFAGQYVATDNSFPVQLNGNNVSLEGYNIEGSTYFKLRDIADVVGGFDVGFNNDTIQLSKDGYVYSNASESKGDSLAYDVIEGNGKKYYVLKNVPTYVTNSNVGGKAFIGIYADTQGTQYVSYSEVDTACAKSGLFCALFPQSTGTTWDFKEYRSSQFETVSSGTLFVGPDVKDFYILLDDYTSKIAPTLNQYIEKYYL